MMTAIVSVLGIVSTVLAWKLNPRRLIYAELDSIYRKLEDLYKERDEALKNNDTDTLTRVTADIVRLAQRKNSLLQRLG